MTYINLIQIANKLENQNNFRSADLIDQQLIKSADLAKTNIDTTDSAEKKLRGGIVNQYLDPLKLKSKFTPEETKKYNHYKQKIVDKSVNLDKLKNWILTKDMTLSEKVKKTLLNEISNEYGLRSSSQLFEKPKDLIDLGYKGMEAAFAVGDVRAVGGYGKAIGKALKSPSVSGSGGRIAYDFLKKIDPQGGVISKLNKLGKFAIFAQALLAAPSMINYINKVQQGTFNNEVWNDPTERAKFLQAIFQIASIIPGLAPIFRPLEAGLSLGLTASDTYYAALGGRATEEALSRMGGPVKTSVKSIMEDPNISNDVKILINKHLSPVAMEYLKLKIPLRTTDLIQKNENLLKDPLYKKILKKDKGLLGSGLFAGKQDEINFFQLNKAALNIVNEINKILKPKIS